MSKRALPELPAAIRDKGGMIEPGDRSTMNGNSGHAQPTGYFDMGGQVQAQAMAKTPVYDNGGMIGDNSQRMEMQRMTRSVPMRDMGGGIAGAGPMMTADAGSYVPSGAVNPRPPAVPGETTKPDNALAPPGDGRMMASIDGSGQPDVAVQSGEFFMNRAATNMRGPDVLAGINESARMALGSHDMNGNVFPRTGAEAMAPEMAGAQGPGIPPMERTQPLTAQDSQILMAALSDPVLGSTLMKIIPLEMQPMIMQAASAGVGPGPAGPMLPAPNTGPVPAGGGTAALANVTA